MKKRLRLKHNILERAWHSNNWKHKAKKKYKDPSHPAFNVTYSTNGRITMCIDLVKGLDSMSWNATGDAKLVAQYISRLVNKYYSNGKPITEEIRNKIFEEVEKYISKTRDIFEKL